jgi:hypothetical protein
MLWFVVGAPIFLLIIGMFTMGMGRGKDATAFVLCTLIAYGGGLIGLGMAIRARRAWSRRNALDYEASKIIAQRLSDIGGRFESVSDQSSGMRVIQGATVGEISQHFDQRVSASISGWLQHELGFHGWGVGVSVGRVGVGVGQLGLSGASSVNLDVSGVMRDNLSGDGFIAVLEQEQQNGMIDTLRIIAPSEPACREYITHLLSAIGPTFGPGSHVDATFQRYAPQLAASFPSDVPHVSDQLRAMLRQPPERRPTVSVVGDDLGGWAILGGALRVGADGPWQQLFPLSLNRAILSAAEDFRKNYAHHAEKSERVAEIAQEGNASPKPTAVVRRSIKTCTNCNTQNDGDAKQCTNCDKKL